MEIGQATYEFISAHRREDVRTLALRGGVGCEAVDMPFALDQIRGWQVARAKLPSWAGVEVIVYPPHLSMEQCSSEATARYKGEVLRRWCGEASSLVDLTGGLGVDFAFIARAMRPSATCTYVERQELLCDIARHNFPLLGLGRAEVVCGDGVEFLHSLAHASVIFLDPARRDAHGGKTVLLEDCVPNVRTIRDELLAKADVVMLKLSPMLDWHRAVAELNEGLVGGCVAEVHIVSVGNECKELLLVLSAEGSGNVVCVNDDEVFVFSDKPALHPSAGLVGRLEPVPSLLPSAWSYLYEPNASIMKAGCFDEIADFYGVSQVGRNSHLFVSDEWKEAFPGRKFRITGISSMNKRELRRALAGVERANIATRNFPLTVAELRKRLKLKDGGDTYVFATTTDDNRHLLLITRKATP